MNAGEAAAAGRRRKSKAHFYSPWRQSRNLDAANIKIELTRDGGESEPVPPVKPIATDDSEQGPAAS
jgi:hypothetical protein